MDYGDLFKRGWQITWNNKFLYILGFLAALGGSGSSGGGGGSNFNNLSNTTGTGGDGSEFEEFFQDFGFDPNNIESMFAGIIGVAVAIVCVLVIIRIVLWFVRLIAEGGMIQAVTELDRGGTSSFREAWRAGRPYMTDMFVVNLILWAIPIVLFLILFAIIGISVGSAIANDTVPDESIAFIAIPIVCLACLMVPYSLIVGLIYPSAQRGIIFKGLKGMEAIRYGWGLLREKSSDILILALLFTVTGFIVGIISLLVSLPILAATGIPVIMAFVNGETPGVGSFVLLGVGVLLLIVISSIVNAIFISWRSATFTLAWHQLDGDGGAQPAEKDPSDFPVPPLEPDAV